MDLISRWAARLAGIVDDSDDERTLMSETVSWCSDSKGESVDNLIQVVLKTIGVMSQKRSTAVEMCVRGLETIVANVDLSINNRHHILRFLQQTGTNSVPLFERFKNHMICMCESIFSSQEHIDRANIISQIKCAAQILV